MPATVGQYTNNNYIGPEPMLLHVDVKARHQNLIFVRTKISWMPQASLNHKQCSKHKNGRKNRRKIIRSQIGPSPLAFPAIRTDLRRRLDRLSAVWANFGLFGFGHNITLPSARRKHRPSNCHTWGGIAHVTGCSMARTAASISSCLIIPFPASRRTSVVKYSLSS